MGIGAAQYAAEQRFFGGTGARHGGAAAGRGCAWLWAALEGKGGGGVACEVQGRSQALDKEGRGSWASVPQMESRRDSRD